MGARVCTCHPWPTATLGQPEQPRLARARLWLGLWTSLFKPVSSSRKVSGPMTSASSWVSKQQSDHQFPISQQGAIVTAQEGGKATVSTSSGRHGHVGPRPLANHRVLFHSQGGGGTLSGQACDGAIPPWLLPSEAKEPLPLKRPQSPQQTQLMRGSTPSLGGFGVNDQVPTAQPSVPQQTCIRRPGPIWGLGIPGPACQPALNGARGVAQ